MNKKSDKLEEIKGVMNVYFENSLDEINKKELFAVFKLNRNYPR